MVPQVGPGRVVPIHSAARSLYDILLERANLRQDGQWVAGLSADLAEQESFKVDVAPGLARQLPGQLEAEHHPSKLFSYFGDSNRFVLTAGAQSEHTAWALVYGLAERGNRRLVLVLPHDAAFATMQRIPWLTEKSRPEIWLHRDGVLQDAPAPECSRLDTIEAVRAQASKRSSGAGPAGELRAASTPKHLGEQSAGVRQLVEWATSNPQLDAAHNQSTRSWSCAGQKVLSLDSGRGLVHVRAGIHDRQRMSAPDESVEPGQALSTEQLATLKQNVENAIAARIDPGGPYYKPDEHWFQSVLRRDPSIVGVESPALREVPAWRPAAAACSFGRGFIDLLGLDGHGDIRIVEAKLAKSSDDMTLMQGIDYHVWAHAYRDALAEKLSAPNDAELRLHFVIGTVGSDQKLFHPRLAAYASCVDANAIPFQFHTVRGWHTQVPSSRQEIYTQSFPNGKIPPGARARLGHPAPCQTRLT